MTTFIDIHNYMTMHIFLNKLCNYIYIYIFGWFKKKLNIHVLPL